MEVWNELSECIKELKLALDDLPKKIVEYASCEKEYRVAKARKILELKKEGYPATLIPDLAKGDEHIAELCCKRDIAKELLKTGYEFIEVKRSEQSSLKTMYDKEYSNMK